MIRLIFKSDIDKIKFLLVMPSLESNIFLKESFQKR